MISEAKHDLDVSPMEPDYGADEVADLLSQGEPAIKVPGLRTVWFSGEARTCYIDGEAWPCRIRGMPPPSPCSATRTWSPRTTWRSCRPGRLPATADPPRQPRLLVLRLSCAAWARHRQGAAVTSGAFRSRELLFSPPCWQPDGLHYTCDGRPSRPVSPPPSSPLLFNNIRSTPGANAEWEPEWAGAEKPIILARKINSERKTLSW